MEATTPFSELNISPEQGAEFMQIAGLDAIDLENHFTFNKIRDVLGFFTQFEDGMFQVKKLVMGIPQQDRLNLLFESMGALQELDQTSKEVADLEKKLFEKKTKLSSLDDMVNRLRK